MFRNALRFAVASIACGLFSIASTVAAASGELGGSPSSSKFTELDSPLPGRRAAHTETVLQDGLVLITGGFSSSTFPAEALRTAVLFDPSTQLFTTLDSKMRSPRTSHTATLLRNGQVLLAGGQTNNDGDGTNTAEIFDPISQTFKSVAATLFSGRGGHAATLLPDGKVLLAGGYYNGDSLRSAEVFDPATGEFALLPAMMTSPRADFTATSLPNGQVLLAGGGSSDVVSNTAELFDPVTQTFNAISAKLTSARAAHAASLLPDGRVLLTGGSRSQFTKSDILKTAEIFDPQTMKFSAIKARMTSPRVFHAAALLADGKVLVTGGGKVKSDDAGVVLKTAETFGP